MASNAVSSNAVSTVVGVLLNKGNFNESTVNLPQSIAIIGEANTANQSGLNTDPQTITSSAQAGTLYGYGSPIYDVARILFNNGVAIPVTVYPQAEASGAVAKVITITTTGTATAAGTIYLKICGRKTKDTGSYAVNIAAGDTPTLVSNKMRAAVASVLGAPVTGSGSTTAIFTAKWKGLTSNDINIVVDTNNTSTGCTFAVANTTAGSGTPSVATSLTSFGNNWQTMVINCYSLTTAVLDELEAFNGVPDPTSPTGRYEPTVWKPFIALCGSVADDPTGVTSARSTQVTAAVCPAPLSLGMPYEAAANMAVLWSKCAQNTPEGDIIGQYYPDMPGVADGDIPQMTDYSFRQYCATHGCSTVDYVGSRYIVKDFITTYDLSGEYPPFYRWCRDLNIYFNVEFGYRLMQQNTLVGKVLVGDNDIVSSPLAIKPKAWRGMVSAYVADCITRALLTDQAFTDASITTGISNQNPNRLDTTFNVKITGLARVCATTITGGFNFGS